jgi:mannose/fructose/N-acetylgalactosamine-specific phosphotransferase system component IIC
MRWIDIAALWLVLGFVLGALLGLAFLRIALIGLGIGLPDLSANAEEQQQNVSQHAQGLQFEYTPQSLIESIGELQVRSRHSRRVI